MAGGDGLHHEYQPTFGAGELDPTLHWRLDLEKNQAGATRVYNCVVTAQGSVARRAGTQYVGTTKAGGNAQRLLPFQFSTEQQYIIEAGDRYFRFVTRGAYLTSAGAPYEIATPYLAADVNDLRFVQSADVLTIVHTGYQQMELRRYGTVDWRLTSVAIGTQLAAPTGLTANGVFDAAVPGTPAPSDRTYQYAVTASKFSTSDESNLSASASCVNKDLGYYNQYGHRNHLFWNGVAGADFYTVYRYFQGTWSKIGSTTVLQFDDINYVPNTASGPPSATNPFAGNNWPGTVGYFQERMIFGGSKAQPETLWLSKSGNYRNFDVANPVRADDAITYTLAARQINQIRHILPLSDLIVMTGSGGWKVGASGGGAITPSNIDVAPQSFVGASSITPLVIGNRILFVEAKGSSVREIAYQFVANTYVSEDRSVFARHLLYGHTVVSWAWSEAPDKVLWMVREDGTLLSMTYLPEQKVHAWARHETVSGLFKSVVVVTEFGDDGQLEDVPYFLVSRPDAGGGPDVTMVERMSTRRLGVGDNDISLAWHVDCGLRYLGDSLPPVSVMSGLTHIRDGTVVNYLADGVAGAATVINGSFTLPVPARRVVAGFPMVSLLETLPARGGRPDDPALGRPKNGFRTRIAVRNTLGLVVTVDGSQAADLLDPQSQVVPSLLYSGVLTSRPQEGWVRDGRVTVSVASANPATVLGMVTEWSVGE